MRGKLVKKSLVPVGSRWFCTYCLIQRINIILFLLNLLHILRKYFSIVRILQSLFNFKIVSSELHGIGVLSTQTVDVTKCHLLVNKINFDLDSLNLNFHLEKHGFTILAGVKDV
jgi:hypothetical protein